MLSEQDIIEKFNSCEYIYGYLYCSGHSTSGDIIKIKKSKLKLQQNQNPFNREDFKELALIYVWGWPGPDFNTYYLKDYGKTWAFTKEDFINLEGMFV